MNDRDRIVVIDSFIPQEVSIELEQIIKKCVFSSTKIPPNKKGEYLKEKLSSKFKKNPEKIDELIANYDMISSKKNNFDVYLVCNNCNSTYTINSKSIILTTNLGGEQLKDYINCFFYKIWQFKCRNYHSKW